MPALPALLSLPGETPSVPQYTSHGHWAAQVLSRSRSGWQRDIVPGLCCTRFEVQGITMPCPRIRQRRPGLALSPETRCHWQVPRAHTWKWRWLMVA